MLFLFDSSNGEVDGVVYIPCLCLCECVRVCQTSLAESLSCRDPPTEGNTYYLHISCQEEWTSPAGPTV